MYEPGKTPVAPSGESGLGGVNSTSTDEAARQIRLFADPSQFELLEVLQNRHPLLGQTYEGALRALADEQNPESLVHCAHSLRELIGALPLAVRDEKKRPASLKAKVVEVAEAWKRQTGKTATLAGGGWNGPIDGPLRKVLRHLAEFFRWFEEEHPRHTSDRDVALDMFDPSGRPLPDHLRKRRGQQIDDLDQFMNQVAHHNKLAISRAEFSVRVAQTEALIRTLVIVTPYEDRKVLDDLLKDE